MRQFIVTTLNPRDGTGSIEVTNSEDRVGQIIDSLKPEELFFVNERNEVILLEEGRRRYDHDNN